jgi:hypothetical protein
MKQLRYLRSSNRDEGHGAGVSQQDFHVAQSMLLQELRNDDDCPICMDFYDRHGQDVAVLDGCGHCLCVSCAAKWAKSSATLDDSVASPRAVGIRQTSQDAFQCPLCNHIVTHVYIQLEQNGRYMPSGRWRRVGVPNLLISYSCADLAEEDSGWSIVGGPDPLFAAVGVTYGRGGENEDDVTPDCSYAHRYNEAIASFQNGVTAEEEDEGEEEERNGGQWEASCIDLEDNLMQRQGGRKSRQLVSEASRRRRKVRGGTSRLVRSVFKGIGQNCPTAHLQAKSLDESSH